MREVSWAKVASIAGILFVVLLIAGIATTGDMPATDASDSEHVDWWSDSGNQTRMIVSAYLITLASLAFVAFLVAMRARLLAQPGSELLARFSFAAGLLFAALLIAATISIGQVAGAVKFGDAPLPAVDFLRMFPQFGYGLMLLGGGLSAAASVAAASWAILRTGAFERWLGWLGIVCAIVLLLGVFFLPMVALLIWVLAASVLLWRRPLTA